MTSIATPSPISEHSLPTRIAVVVIVACAGALAAALTIWFVQRSPTLYRAEASGILRGIYVAAWTAAGLYTWWRRPTSRLGLLLGGIGAFYALSSLNASADDVAFTLGMVAWACWVALLLSVALCFPRSRPSSQLETTFVRGLWLGTAALWALILVFADKLPKAGEFADCGSRCPDNGLQLVDAHNAGRALDALYSVAYAAALVAAAVLLVRKARSPSRLRRRAVEPLSYVIGATAVTAALNAALVRVAPGTRGAFWAIEAVVALAAPVAIVIGQARGRMFTATQAGRLAAQMEGRPVTAGGVQTLLRDALGDPTLVLALAADEPGALVDSRGVRFELPEASDPRAVTAVTRDGRTIAVLVHDPALDTDPSVIEGIAATSLMLLENARLVDELQASRGRIVTAAETERLRLERDLHDGAQQRLMAIQIKLALLRESADAQALADGLDEIGDDAAAAVDELRALAHGIYPTVLRERGIADGIRELARSSPLPIDVVDNGIGRCDTTAEAAIYFCVAEAIQNATKHAGPATRVTVSLDRDGDDVRFAISDDGAGFDSSATQAGTGLLGMRDRIGAVGGDVEVESSPGRGTIVRGRVPAVSRPARGQAGSPSRP